MAPGGEAKANPGGGGVKGGRKRKYLPHGKPVRKGAYPLRPGVQGFFITCDGGRERDATRDVLSLLDSFYEDLVDGKGSSEKPKSIPDKPMNKKITFDSDSSDDEDEDHAGEEANEDHVGEEANKDHAGEEANKDHAGEEANKDHAGEEANKNHAGEEVDNGNDAKKGETTPSEPQQEVLGASGSVNKDDEEQVDDADASKPKKPRVEDPPVSEQADQKKSTDKPKEPADKPKESTEKNIDDLIDEDLKELGDRKKRLFASLDTGCNGCIFIQMHKSAGDPGPVEIVQSMMSSAASTRKHMSRFILRFLPVEIACYASEEEITRAIAPLVEKYFPKECSSGHKYAVLYEARSNTGIDRIQQPTTTTTKPFSPKQVGVG